jgi:spore coat polysaccharide biosynthesis protein SpsF
MGQAAIVLQARMGSVRLPGKTLADLHGRTLLEHCLTRLSASGLPVIVATTDRPEDDAVAQAAGRFGAGVFRGDATDVLGRYVETTRAYGLSTVLRATADNPLVDTGASRRVLDLIRNVGGDHVVEFGLPVGAAVEAVSVDALERAHARAVDPYDREHVTSFIRRDPAFQALRAMAPRRLRRPGLRLTVDTPTDLAFVRDVLTACGGQTGEPALDRVIQAADAVLVRMAAAERQQRGA